MTNKQQWEKRFNEKYCQKWYRGEPLKFSKYGNQWNTSLYTTPENIKSFIRKTRQEALEDAEIAHLKELEIQLKDQKQDLLKELNKIEIPYGCLQVKEQLEKFNQLLK